MTFLSKTSGETQVKITFKEAILENEKYTRASWIATLVMSFQVLTGYYAIIAYSEVIFENEFTADMRITARTGT